MAWIAPPDWLLYGAAIAAVALALPLLYFSLLHDRSRGRARCPRCWYDMGALIDPSGSTPLRVATCPECGHAPRRVRDFYRTRRRRIPALLALLLLLASPGMALWPPIRANGFWPTMPTTVLIAAESIVGIDTWPALSRARATRLYSGRHSQWQWSVLLARSSYLRIRTRWPDGFQVRVPSEIHFFLPLDGDDQEISITPLHTLPEPESAAHRSAREQTLTHEPVWMDDTVPIDPGPRRIAVFRARIYGTARDQPLYTFDIEVPLDIRGGIDDVMQRAWELGDSPTQCRLLQLSSSGRWAVAVSSWSRFAAYPLTQRLTILRNDRVVATARWAGPLPLTALLEGETDALSSMAADPAGWRILVESDDALALAQPTDFINRRWVGSYEIPLAEFLAARTPAP